jgi:hypothetical protein
MPMCRPEKRKKDSQVSHQDRQDCIPFALYVPEHDTVVEKILTFVFLSPVQRSPKRVASTEGLKDSVEGPPGRLAGCHCRTNSSTLYST